MLVHDDELVRNVIGCAIEVHRQLGPGLLESAYGACLAHELAAQGIAAAAQVPVPLLYKGVRLECGFRADFVVERRLLLELKSVDRVLPVHHAQVQTYLRLLNVPHGLILNFNEKRLIDGIRSVLLGRRRS